MGVPYFRVMLDALHAAGRDQAVVTALTDPKRPGYAQILTQGATFTWESWIAPQIGDSESHGWGSAVLAAMYDDVLGLRISKPGASEVDVQVPNSSVTHASGTEWTQRGPVTVAWTRSGTHETVDLTLPVGVVAHVHVPARIVDVGSGHHTFDETGETTPAPKPAEPEKSSSSSSKVALIIGFGALMLVGVGIGIFLVMRRRTP
jgi:hypothetical protein